MTPDGSKRVAIYGPPRFWAAAFNEVRRRGDRVVRLVLPAAGTEAHQLQACLGDLRSGRIDELLVDLLAG